MKIKLERFKEVVRLEVVENNICNRIRVTDNNKLDDNLIIECNISTHLDYCEKENRVYIDIGYKGHDVFVLETEQEAIIYHNKAMRLVEEYNNSIKDGGYTYICTGCAAMCKNRFLEMPVEDRCLYPGPENKTDWQPIQNNKIEVVE